MEEALQQVSTYLETEPPYDRDHLEEQRDDTRERYDTYQRNALFSYGSSLALGSFLWVQHAATALDYAPESENLFAVNLAMAVTSLATAAVYDYKEDQEEEALETFEDALNAME